MTRQKSNIHLLKNLAVNQLTDHMINLLRQNHPTRNLAADQKKGYPFAIAVDHVISHLMDHMINHMTDHTERCTIEDLVVNQKIASYVVDLAVIASHMTDHLTGGTVDILMVRSETNLVAGHLTRNMADHLIRNAVDIVDHLTRNAVDIAGHLTRNTVDIPGHLTRNAVDIAGHLKRNAVDIAGHLTRNPVETAGHLTIEGMLLEDITAELITKLVVDHVKDKMEEIEDVGADPGEGDLGHAADPKVQDHMINHIASRKRNPVSGVAEDQEIADHRTVLEIQDGQKINPSSISLVYMYIFYNENNYWC